MLARYPVLRSMVSSGSGHRGERVDDPATLLAPLLRVLEALDQGVDVESRRRQRASLRRRDVADLDRDLADLDDDAAGRAGVDDTADDPAGDRAGSGGGRRRAEVLVEFAHQRVQTAGAQPVLVGARNLLEPGLRPLL